jgi:hypothetical protein
MALPARTREEHRYQLCGDDDCERFPCRVYKEGYRNGFADGHAAGWAAGWAAGYAKGHADGYAQGFPDGIAACPRPHGGK